MAALSAKGRATYCIVIPWECGIEIDILAMCNPQRTAAFAKTSPPTVYGGVSPFQNERVYLVHAAHESTSHMHYLASSFPD